MNLKKSPIARRLEGLKYEIDKQIARINNDENRDLLEFHKLYFNLNDGD